MERKIRVCLIYHKSNIFLTGKHFDNTYYHFFITSLKKNKAIDYQLIATDDVFDFSKLRGKYDIILLWDNGPFGMPKNMQDIKEIEIPIISRVTDYGAKGQKSVKKLRELNEKCGIDYYFDFVPEDYFHEHYPDNFKYKTIIFGLESSLYNNLKPFDERIKDRILLTGAIGNKKFFSKIINDIRWPKWNAYRFYNLRTKCSSLPYVDYTPTLQHNYVNDRYPQLLEQYASSIVAATYVPSIKYWENAAAGCLTFMEISKLNKGHFLGYRDNESCIFIDQKNYKEKFEEYLSDTKNPKWKEIANAGREFTLQNYTNDKAVDSLVELMRTLI